MSARIVVVCALTALVFAANALADAPMPDPPTDGDKAALVEYQAALERWGADNAKSFDEFSQATADAYYQSTLEILQCALDDEETVKYNETLANVLGYAALRDARASGKLQGEKFDELRTRAAQARARFLDSQSETDKNVCLAYIRQLFAIRLNFALSRPAEERDELFASLVGDAITFALAMPDYGEDAYNLVLAVRVNSRELGEDALDAICDAFEASENPKLTKPIQKTSGVRRYARLPGSTLYFKALFPDENGEFTKPFDPEELKGKPYLVEVWATWCGPCRKEIPRLKEVYARYRDAGFEILGYSIDQDLDALKTFLKDNEIPWRVASQKRSMEEGFKGLYDYYAINGVPEMILVGRDGKVIETDCRGMKLARALQKLFPDVEPLDWTPENDFSARDQAPK